MKPTLSLLIIFIFPLFLSAQTKTWREHKTAAIDHFNNGRFTEAGFEYEKAWKKKKKKTELIYSAGEAYYLDKEFRRAARALENVKDDNKNFDMVGLMYARALKQDKQYSEANAAFLSFLNSYNGPQKSKLSKIIQNEIKGCDLGLELEGQKNKDYKVSHIETFNSEFIEFGPRAYTDETIYFSTTKDGNAKLLRSHYKNGRWTNPEKPKGFRKFKNEHFGNGNFSPDGKRMYFTKCKEIKDRTGQYTECEIYMIKKKKNEWGNATRLRDYVNIEGYTSTQPTIVHKDGKEIIYFASNRKGGKGGMDIWYMSRDLNSDGIDFSLPKNCGKTINGPGDEITPFYDEYSDALFFSSTGHPGLGGFDIFESHGSFNKWTEVENMGIPINSSVDDYYYTHAPSRSGGFFVSTRKFGSKKKTTDEDIYSFKIKNHEGLLTGKIETLDGLLATDVVLSLYEILPNRRRFLSKVVSENGEYSFVLLPNKSFELEIEKDGYDKIIKKFSTSNQGQVENFDKTIVLNSNDALASNEEEVVIVKKKPIKKAVVVTKKVKPVSQPTKINKEPKIVSKPAVIVTKQEPIVVQKEKVIVAYNENDRGAHLYKIQLTSGPKIKWQRTRFTNLQPREAYTTEYIDSKGWTRVFMSSYDNLEEARKDLSKAKSSGFKRAFIAEYYGNDRVKKIIRK